MEQRNLSNVSHNKDNNNQG